MTTTHPFNIVYSIRRCFAKFKCINAIWPQVDKRVTGISSPSFKMTSLHVCPQVYMCEKSFPRAERKVFNTLGSTAAVLDFLDRRYDIRPA